MSVSKVLSMAEQAKAIRKCLQCDEPIPISLQPMMDRLKVVGTDVLEAPNMPAIIQTLIDLEAILFHGYRPKFGICSGLQTRIIFCRIAQEWPEHSGLYSYPVNHPAGAALGFELGIKPAEREGYFWDGSYGEARLRLAAFVYDELIRHHPWYDRV